MASQYNVYISGPDVFLPGADALIAAKVALVNQYGFGAIIPGDTTLGGGVAPPSLSPPSSPAPLPTGKGLSRLIYAANVAAMQHADFAICHLTPFRGPSADPGTVFELGMMAGMGKPVFAYTNSTQDYRSRIGTQEQRPGSTPPVWSDVLDCRIEDFGNCDNLMLDGAVEACAGPIVRCAVPMSQLYTALDGFVACLQAARAHYGLAPL